MTTRLLHSNNLGDRTFCLYNGRLWERRWQNNAWRWLHHEHAPVSGASSIGVLLGHTTEDVAALYIRDAPGLYPGVGVGGVFNLASWKIYRFQLSANDPTDPDDIKRDGYDLIESVSLPTVSGLQVSPTWKLYAQVIVDEVDLNASASTSVLSPNQVLGIGAARFDVDLNVEAWNPVAEVFDNQFEIDGGLGVMSDHDVFVLPDITSNERDSLFHFNADFGGSVHSGKKLAEISDGKDPDTARVFGFQRDGELFERVFDSGKWDWRRHGRPVAKKDFKHIVPGTMRQFRNKLMFVAKTTWGNYLYERWTDGAGGWWWAEHGYPANETITDIGHPMQDSFFVATASGRLWQRHYRHNEQQWAWQDHGIPA